MTVTHRPSRVPIVIPDSEEQVGELEAGEFDTLWHVLRALRARDEQFGAALDMHRAQYPAGDLELPDKVTLTLPPGTSHELLQQLRLLTVRQTTSPFWEYLSALRAFHSDHGHPHVPSRYVTPEGLELGRWCDTRRAARKGGWIPAWQVKALDEFGFSWSRRDDRYRQFLDELSALPQNLRQRWSARNPYHAQRLPARRPHRQLSMVAAHRTTPRGKGPRPAPIRRDQHRSTGREVIAGESSTPDGRMGHRGQPRHRPRHRAGRIIEKIQLAVRTQAPLAGQPRHDWNII